MGLFNEPYKAPLGGPASQKQSQPTSGNKFSNKLKTHSSQPRRLQPSSKIPDQPGRDSSKPGRDSNQPEDPSQPSASLEQKCRCHHLQRHQKQLSDVERVTAASFFRPSYGCGIWHKKWMDGASSKFDSWKGAFVIIRVFCHHSDTSSSQPVRHW